MIEDLNIRLPYFNILTPLAETPYYYELLKAGKFKKDLWQEFSNDPVKDFIIPEVRPLDEEMWLREVVKDYVEIFKHKDLEVFAT